MAKGDYSSKYGGSRSGYDKGTKDANDSMINRVINIIGKIADAFVEAGKKR
jgi:hypothetical protein